MRLETSLLLGAALVALAAGQASAAAAVYDAPPTLAGDQGYSGILGDDFTVNSAVTVTALGAFDSGKTGITTDIMIGLYDLTTAAYVTPVVNFNGTPDPTNAAFVFQAITPVHLIAGHNYSIVGMGFNGVDRNYNTNTDTPLRNGTSPVTFNTLYGALTNDFSRYAGADPSGSVVFPYASAFGAGTLVAYVPEPAAWALMLIGIGGVGVALRGRRQLALARAV